MVRNCKGFTLIEMIIVMTVFITVIIISGNVFNTVLQQASKIVRSEESNIEGIVGLEMFRHDLQQAGYGLFTEPLCTAYNGEAIGEPASDYNEIKRTIADPCDNDVVKEIPANRLPPRAMVAGNNLDGTEGNILAGSDYLALKGLTLARNAASQKWTYLEKDASGTVPKVWPSKAENLISSDRVMLMRRSVDQSDKTYAIEPNAASGNAFFRQFNSSFAQYSTNTYQYVVYGLDDDGTPRMPFNRSDYFVAKPDSSVSPICAKGIGNLYKATINQGDGQRSLLPLLDCVADMQVVFGWDLTIGNSSATGQDGIIDTWSSPDPKSSTGSASEADLKAAMEDPKLLSAALKIIKVYVLAQVGRKDSGYTSTSPILVGEEGESSITHSYALTQDMLNYHWKVFRIVVRPKNLVSNQ